MRPIAADKAYAGSESGFTLVEVLVSLAVLAVMSALMLSVMGQFRLLIETDTRIEQKLALEATLRHMARLAGTAERMPLMRADGDGDSFLEGNESSLRFVAVARRGAFDEGFGEVTLRLEGGNEKKRAVQIFTPRRTSVSDADKQAVELASDVRSLSFAYLGVSGGDQSAQWHQTWNVPNRLPAAIRITLETMSRGKPLSTVAVARLQLAD